MLVKREVGLGTQGPDLDFEVGGLTVALRLAAHLVVSGWWAVQELGFVLPVTSWVPYQFVCTNHDQNSVQDKLKQSAYLIATTD